MAVVVERAARGARALPLVCGADSGRPLAWHQSRCVGVEAFLADVATVAAVLPHGPAAVNLCEDRYAFLVAFCAVACRGQANLLPSSRAPHAVEEVLAAHAGSYALSDIAGPAGSVRLPPLGQGRWDGRVPSIPGDQVVAIGFTSGSTGQPKPNPKTWSSFHGSNAGNVDALVRTLGLDRGMTANVVATVPPQHMYGIELSILLPLLGPFAVHGGRPLFPADVVAALESVPAPRLLVTTPVHLRALLGEGVALPELAAITSATAPLPRELALEAERRYDAPLLELFGSTETCVIARRRCARESDFELYPDIQLRPQPDGTLVDAPYFERAVSLQDVVELLPERRFRLCGRNADLVELAGKRASLADLTHRLLGLAGVHDAVVVQLDSADSIGVRRIAALAVAPGRSEAELLNDLRAEIDPAFLPRPLRLVEALPRNETGKLPRTAVLAMIRGEPT